MKWPLAQAIWLGFIRDGELKIVYVTIKSN